VTDRACVNDIANKKRVYCD